MAGQGGAKSACDSRRARRKDAGARERAWRPRCACRADTLRHAHSLLPRFARGSFAHLLSRDQSCNPRSNATSRSNRPEHFVAKLFGSQRHEHGGPSAVSRGQQGSSWRPEPPSVGGKGPFAVQHRRVQPAPPAANMRGACGVACCIALIGAPLGRGQMLDGSPPPRGAWNGAPPGTELLQWGCTDGASSVRTSRLARGSFASEL